MTAQYQDYYATLGVSRGASADEIQRAYRKLAREFHPDVNKSADAEKKFKQINEAYEVLKDPEKRKLYDELGSNWKAGESFRPPPGWSGWQEARPGRAGRAPRTGPGGVEFEFSNVGDFSEFFESLFGGHAEPFGGMGGFGGTAGRRSGDAGARSHRRSRAGATIESELNVSLLDVYQMATRRISLRTERDHVERTFDVKIPPGIRNGGVIRLASQGEPGAHGGPSGDLLIRIHILPDPRFRIDEQTGDITTTLPISPWEAALGAKISAPTVDGEVLLTIPPGSQSGQRLRIREKGLPNKAGSRADLFVELKIVVPKNIEGEEKILFERLAQVSNFQPRRT